MKTEKLVDLAGKWLPSAHTAFTQNKSPTFTDDQVEYLRPSDIFGMGILCIHLIPINA
jgi:hypothetical protein